MAKKNSAAPTVGKTLAHSETLALLAKRPTGSSEGRRIDAVHAERSSVLVKRRVGTSHKFRAGQTVTLIPNRYGSNRHGSFEVTRLLPEEHGINHYRLKSVADGHERVAAEDELL